MDATSRWVVEWLLNSAWQVALVVFAAWLADRVLRRAPARFRHMLWVAALILSLVVPLVSLLTTGSPQGQSAVSPPGLSVRPELPTTVPRQASAVGALTASARVARSADRWRLSVWKSAVGDLLGRRSITLSLSSGFTRLIVFVYLLSLLLNGARLGLAWARTRGVSKTARRCPLPDRLQSVVARWQASLGVESIPILFSERARSPLTLGVRRPVILLPHRLIESTSTEDLAAALCHEMAHICRRDYFWNVVYQLAYQPLAVHPAAALIQRRINRTRELACDEIAAACLGAASYARSLVNLARSLSAPPDLEPGYTLGVLDAGILEERVMRLLDHRPKSSPRTTHALAVSVVSLLAVFSLAVSLFSLTLLATSSGQGRPDFSGIWELDPAKSRLPNPAPANLVEAIRQTAGSLSIATTSKDWTPSKRIAVTLFGLMIPEFNATTDGAESVQKFGPGAIRSATHWEDDRLITDWTLERDSKVLVKGQWVRSLAPDGQSQLLEVTARDPQRGTTGSATLLFLKRRSAMMPGSFGYAGTWQAVFRGKPFMTLKLTSDGTMLTGSITNGQVRTDAEGNLTSVEVQDGERPVIGSRMKDGSVILTVKDPNTGETEEYQVKLTDDSEAELSFPGSPPPGVVMPKPFKLVRVSGMSSLAPTQGFARMAEVASTTPAIANADESEGSISGTVFDPSGARVPDAVVMILNQQGKQIKAAGTDQEGKFQIAALPAGRYSLEVTKAGFAVYRRYVKLKGHAPAEDQGHEHGLAAGPASLEIVLAPGEVLESVVVTAKAGPNAPVAQRVGPKRIRVGGLIQATKLVNRVKPEYPESARDKGIEGTVLMQAVISLEGEPLSLKVLSSPDDTLTEAAEEAVRQWRYEPTLLNGDPVEVVTTIGVRFQLER